MDYYVDNSVAGNGNGSSWSSAWQDFSDINWSAIKPGDTIFVSGGSTSQTYTDPLTIGASGSAAGNITITAGTDPGHNGSVIIDGQDNLANGVYDNGHNYVTVNGLNVRNITDAGIAVKGATAGVLIENNSVYSGDPNGGNARGYDVRNSVGQNGQYAVTVENNSFTTPGSTTAQTDGIWSSGNNGVLFQGNNIDITNTDSTGHSDDIQSWQDTNITIADNYFAHPNGGINNHGVWIADIETGGTVTVENNIVNMPVGDEIAIAAWNQDAGFNGQANIVNNTVYGGLDDYFLENTPLSELKNNIADGVKGSTGVFISGNAPSAANIDNNLIYTPSGTVADVNNNNESYAQWQANGYDAHGVNANPMFTNPSAGDFSLQSNSPAIGAGASVPGVSGDNIGASQAGTSTGSSQPTPTPAPTPTPTPTPAPTPTPTPTPAPTPTPTPTPAPTPTPTPTPPSSSVVNVPGNEANVSVPVNNATINAGSGNHAFFISGNTNTFNLSGGKETITDNGSGGNTFSLPAAGNGKATFNAAVLNNGDTFDLSAALKATSWDGSADSVNSYLHTRHMGGNTQLFVSSSASNWHGGTLLATFDNTHASLSTVLSHSTL
jgi:hypothetical protein